ncbi:MAG: hypothetical protein DRO23_06385 [Thermoprotei archaeon]|nr:MAG: hypothetical protein DRO23_06385 [Thermoprotei archaeon]
MAETKIYNVTIIVDYVIEEELVKVIRDACREIECRFSIYYKPGLNITPIVNMLEKEGFKVVLARELNQSGHVPLGNIILVLTQISNVGKLYDLFKLKTLGAPVIFILK